MATKVAGDLYVDIDGQIGEIKRQLRQKEGYPFDPMQFSRTSPGGYRRKPRRPPRAAIQNGAAQGNFPGRSLVCHHLRGASCL